MGQPLRTTQGRVKPRLPLPLIPVAGSALSGIESCAALLLTGNGKGCQLAEKQFIGERIKGGTARQDRMNLLQPCPQGLAKGRTCLPMPKARQGIQELVCMAQKASSLPQHPFTRGSRSHIRQGQHLQEKNRQQNRQGYADKKWAV